MKISACETIVDEEKFVKGHEAIISAYEARKEGLHKESRAMLEWRISGYKKRLERYRELKNT